MRQRAIPASRRGIPAADRGIPENLQIVPAIRRVTPAIHRVVPAACGAVPPNRRAVPAIRRVISVRQSVVPGVRRAIPGIQRALPPTRLRRLLKYWDGPRCCRIRCWPRRERSADIHAIPAQRATPASAKFCATLRARGRRGGWPRRSLVAAHTGDAPRSLLAIHPFCLYARAMPVFQQSPRSLRNIPGASGRTPTARLAGEIRPGSEHIILQRRQCPSRRSLCI